MSVNTDIRYVWLAGASWNTETVRRAEREAADAWSHTRNGVAFLVSIVPRACGATYFSYLLTTGQIFIYETLLYFKFLLFRTVANSAAPLFLAA